MNTSIETKTAAVKFSYRIPENSHVELLPQRSLPFVLLEIRSSGRITKYGKDWDCVSQATLKLDAAKTLRDALDAWINTN